MNRLKSLLAVGALTLAGALGATVAQASAANVNVNLVAYNADASLSMIRTSSLSSGLSGFINPASAISPGAYDPSSGNALFSAPAPLVGGFVTSSVTYANASNTSLNICTFTIKLTRVSSASYKLHIEVTGQGMSCSAPGDQTNNDGQFTSTNYTLTWTR